MSCNDSAPPNAKMWTMRTRKHIWLEVGVNSVRNLLHIPWTRKILYLVLLAFSLPIHLVYNSVLVAVGANNEQGMQIAIVTPDFLHGAPAPRNMSNLYNHRYQSLQAELPLMQRLENAARIQAYGQSDIFDWGDLILVTDGHVPSDPSSGNDSLVELIAGGWPPDIPWAWMCTYWAFGKPLRNFQCDTKHLLANPAAWSLNNHSIDYCLAQRTPENCELDFSFHLILVFIICNLVKLISVGTAMLSLNPPSLNTIGDAIASFLAVPDPYTQNMCLTSKSDFQHYHILSRWISPVHPRPWTPRGHFLWIVDGPLWLICNAIGITILVLLACVSRWVVQKTSIAYYGYTYNLSTLWKLGFGNPAPFSDVDLPHSLNPYINERGMKPFLQSVLAINTPQIILALLYILYNALFTNMGTAKEWSRFGHLHQALRVSIPTVGSRQRSTYSLQFPLHYAMCLLGIFVLMHWLATESFFLDRYHVQSSGKTVVMSSTAFAPMSVILLTVAIGIVVLGGLGLSFLRLDSGIPVASNCSAAISAACHPPPGDEDAALGLVQWGVVSSDEQGVGHCSFSSRPVKGLEPEKLYAGYQYKSRSEKTTLS
ncbi:hypothetical protein JMJ35_006747 [Cladonia borealis]|uniref:DUF6536 domain-containing protein n=1 Tax=Cladonia borealis TaxID=184061 RepID=A0AA39QXV6_9LECA|nr:hypothetical protein JMJ35_006747 [Cladonia borealis]